MLFTRDAFARVGGFDERYHLYYEDVDLCARMRLAGREVVFCPTVEIVHAARRESHRNLRFFAWHVQSMLRFFLSGPFRRLVLFGGRRSAAPPRAPRGSQVRSAGSSRTASHRNNFDLLRFAFAFMVFLYHAHVLSGRPGARRALALAFSRPCRQVVFRRERISRFHELSRTPLPSEITLRSAFGASIPPTLPWSHVVALGGRADHDSSAGRVFLGARGYGTSRLIWHF